MAQVDFLYSGLMFAAGMLSLWTMLLVTATFLTLSPSLRKSAARTATISSTNSKRHAAEKATPPRPLSQALPQRSILGRALRLIQ